MIIPPTVERLVRIWRELDRLAAADEAPAWTIDEELAWRVEHHDRLLEEWHRRGTREDRL